MIQSEPLEWSLTFIPHSHNNRILNVGLLVIYFLIIIHISFVNARYFSGPVCLSEYASRLTVLTCYNRGRSDLCAILFYSGHKQLCQRRE